MCFFFLLGVCSASFGFDLVCFVRLIWFLRFALFVLLALCLVCVCGLFDLFFVWFLYVMLWCSVNLFLLVWFGLVWLIWFAGLVWFVTHFCSRKSAEPVFKAPRGAVLI